MSPIVEESGPSVNDLVTFLRDYYKEELGDLAQRYPSEQTSLEVSHSDLRRAFPSFADRYFSESDEVTDRLTEALRQYDLPVDVSLEQARVRITDLPSTEVHDVGVPHVSDIEDRVQGLRGQVSKRSQKQLLMTTAVYECQRCGTLTQIPQTSGTLDEPHECQGCERQGPFRLNKTESTKSDHQLVRLQTPPEASGDGTTDDIDVVLMDDLVGQVAPGDRIIANSRVEIEQQSENSAIFEPVAHAQSLDWIDADYDDIDVSQHRERIREIAASGNAVQWIIGSLVPSHEGDREVKEALALQLFGGVDKTLEDGSETRGTIHILLIGDPGCGKTDLLEYCNNLAPRSLYTTGQGTSSVGLTAAAVQDDFGNGGWTLDAGALVKANDGLCAIDELDDMREEDHAGMLEALSNQTVSVSKAGINTTLPARTTVLAAANPIHGRFDEYEGIAEQFDLPSNLVSRFDLIFPMQDTPDEERDGRIADTILDSAEAGQRNERGEDVSDSAPSPEIEPEVLRAYIAHAKTITPVITDDTKSLIREQYLSLRQAGGDGDTGPVSVTPRMMEALVRLSEASARIRLSEEITTEDAQRAARIHQSYLESVGIDPETGEFDADVIETGTSKSQRDRLRNLKAIIAELVDDPDVGDVGAPIDVVRERAVEAGMSDSKADNEIEKLRREGAIYTMNGDELMLVKE